MTPAKYQSILHSKKPKHDLYGDQGTVHIAAGEYNSIKGVADTFSPVHIYDIHLNINGKIDFILPADFNTGILVIDGSIVINDTAFSENHYVELKNEVGEIHIKATKKTILLVLSGQDLKEPFVSYGPFVMNTNEEIKQAIEDYNNGKLGFLKD